MFESAIPEHLRAERTVLAQMPPGFEPPFPAFSSRFPEKVAGLVMASIGAQYPSVEKFDGVAKSKLESFMSPAGPTYKEWAAATDSKGFYNHTLIAYWPSQESYEKWAVESGFQQWWDSIDPSNASHGWFLEVFFPSVDRLETIFSHPGAPEGVGYLQESQSGPICEHIYWGSMRDRLPASQTEDLKGEAADESKPTVADPKGRVRVHGRKNLAVIRSGQDLSTALPEELKLYHDDLAPVLLKAMNFLRDEGEKVGCHSCRFMDVVDSETRVADKGRTFGLAYFDDLASLEAWSKEHPTHVAIFGGFMQHAARLEGKISLRLFHEVLVLKPEQQFFEYIACQPGTGMLGR